MRKIYLTLLLCMVFVLSAEYVLSVSYGVNCTSCNIPYGDTTPPFETDDTTPTFKFITGTNMSCRIGDTNTTHTLMGASRDCNSGQNVTSHTCTLTAQDALVNYNSSVYINCLNGVDSTNNTEQLYMLISDLEILNDTEAIQQGIENSVVWPGAVVYTNQKVYLRSLNNTVVIATVDKVVVYGNQRWLINHVGPTENKLGLFNMSPVIYSLDMKNVDIKAIRANVTVLINNTVNQ